MFCLLCCTVSPLASPTTVSTPSTSVSSIVVSPTCVSYNSVSTQPMPLSRRSSLESLSSSREVSPPSIKSSPSQRFPHLSPQIMRILAPETEMPMMAPNCQECAERYRRKQDQIVNKLMSFVEEE